MQHITIFLFVYIMISIGPEGRLGGWMNEFGWPGGGWLADLVYLAFVFL
jgi:hypothetical protein